jgi:hypothetical protein
MKTVNAFTLLPKSTNAVQWTTTIQQSKQQHRTNMKKDNTIDDDDLPRQFAVLIVFKFNFSKQKNMKQQATRSQQKMDQMNQNSLMSQNKYRI